MEKEKAEIEKLTERIAKDPKSKLFVPLAEEHKKAGDIETAIRVLSEGLKHNPGYVTARSFLGRLLMDKGDLAGAQKELEEVIKTIPDNLLAQRKLGDLYVLQGKGADALLRYKAALALNPADKDLPSILADLEAGKDVSARIPRSKTLVLPAEVKPQPAPPVQPKTVPPGAPRTGAAPQRTAAPGPGQPTAPPLAMKAEQRTATPVPPVNAAPTTIPSSTTPEEPAAPPLAEQKTAAPVPPVNAAASPIAPAASDEAELIEDIVELESLDQAGPDTGSNEPLPDMLTAPVPFDLSEPLIDNAPVVEENAAIAWDAAETAGPEQVVQAGPDESSDDLNTNTLAELYISQGFYDKAIEIYQGMLNDRPGNTALQQKLEQIKAMAGVVDKGSEQFTDVSTGPGEYAPPAADILPESSARQEVPEQPMAVPGISPPETSAFTQEEKSSRGPAPRRTEQEPTEEPTPSRGPQAATTRRKETIDRLESWLNNIMKEKQE